MIGSVIKEIGCLFRRVTIDMLTYYIQDPNASDFEMKK